MYDVSTFMVYTGSPWTDPKFISDRYKSLKKTVDC
jgi:hypothetical protein